MNCLINLIKLNIQNRNRIWELSKVSLGKKYRGSDLGFLWAFFKPSMYIVVFYVAISIGFRSSKAIDGIDCPYFIWLAIGMICFFYQRDMVLGGASCFRTFKPIVVNSNYPAITIPTSVAISNLIVHAILLVLGLIMSIGFKCTPSIYWLEIPFYLILMVIFSIFWSIATGIFSIIYRDFYNFLQVINQALFWLSAVLFDVNSLGPRAQTVMMFNPITYVVEGYRNAVCRHVWFYEEPVKLLCYLAMMLVMVVISMIMYKKYAHLLPDIL